jgi:hypothetical protein
VFGVTVASSTLPPPPTPPPTTTTPTYTAFPYAERFLHFLPKMGCVVNEEFKVDLTSMAYSVDGCAAGSTLEEAHGDLEVRRAASLV